MTTLSDRVLRWAPYGLLSATLVWVVLRAFHPLADPDAWWHLRLGRTLLEQRSLSAPAWSTYATASWVPTQPLPEMIMALMERAFGLAGVVWAYCVAVASLVIGVFFLNRRFASPLPAVVATMLFVAGAEAAMTPRPQLISYGLLAIVVVVWLLAESDLRPRWWLVPLSLAWSLCHGFWFVGVGYGALAVLSIAIITRPPWRTLLHLALVPIASGLVVLLNPAGPRVFVAPLVVHARGDFITEWQRPALTSGPTLIVLATVVLCVGVWIWQRDEVTAFRVIVALTAVIFALYAVRTVALGAAVMSPIVASALERAVARSGTSLDEKQGPRLGRREVASLVAGSGALLALVLALSPHVASQPADNVPVAFDERLDRLPPGTTVLNDYTVGGWLAWAHPDLNRWVDGLADAYPVSHLRDVTTVQFQQTSWRRVLSRSDAKVAILEEGMSAQRGFEAAGWRVVTTDRGWVLLRLDSGDK